MAGAQPKTQPTNYPVAVRIPVNQSCHKVHFLHGAAWREPDGAVIGKIIIHFQSGRIAEQPIVYGKNVRESDGDEIETGFDTNSTVAWRSTGHVYAKRLYKLSWENATPSDPVTSVEYVSNMTQCAPFLLAVTTEP